MIDRRRDSGRECSGGRATLFVDEEDGFALTSEIVSRWSSDEVWGPRVVEAALASQAEDDSGWGLRLGLFEENLRRSEVGGLGVRAEMAT